MFASPSSPLWGNRLLAALPSEELERLTPHLEQISLPAQQVIYDPGTVIQEVYFPNPAMVSLVASTEEGNTVEVGIVGMEGVVGVPCVLGGQTTIHRAIVQVPGQALRMSASVLKAEFERGGYLQKILLRYIQALLTQVSQLALCNCLHTVEERLARWLLSVRNSVQSDEFYLTQEFIAQMLGTRRSGVTVAAGKLQQAGMIRYSRGRISILNRPTLESVTCECYATIYKELDRLLHDQWQLQE